MLIKCSRIADLYKTFLFQVFLTCCGQFIPYFCYKRFHKNGHKCKDLEKYRKYNTDKTIIH